MATMLWAWPANAAPFAYVTNQFDNTVSVIDSATNTVTATIEVESFPSGIALTPNGMFAYVANSISNSVSVIATATNAVVATVPVGPGAEGIALTPNGMFAYVTNADSNTVSVVATASNTVVATITVGQRPSFVAITPNGRFAYVTNQTSATVSVIATATNKVVATVALGAGAVPQGIAITPSGAFAYVGNQGPGTVSVIATATNTIVSTITAPPPYLTQGVAIGPRGTYAYVTGFYGPVEVISTSTNTVVASIPLTGGLAGLAFTPNGAFVYVAMQGSNIVPVIATATNTVVANITVGYGPRSVAFAPSPAVLSVTPNPASGLSKTFALTSTDLYGASDLGLVEVMFTSEVSTSNSCAVFYAPSTNLVHLLNDPGTGTSSITPGSGTLSNSQCSISGSGTSVVTSGNNLTLNLAVTASSTYTGRHSIFMFAEDSRGGGAGWVNKGTWTPSANQAPAMISVTPNPASGLSNTFALTYSDPNGAADLSIVEVIFNSTVSAANSCEVLYFPGINLLYQLNDAGTEFSSITPGSGMLSNSQCSIDGSGTSVVKSGDNLTLNLDVTASPTFTGTKNIFMFAEDGSSAHTGAVNAGTWTP
jgi:YVTN family beta-propeller protein